MVNKIIKIHHTKATNFYINVIINSVNIKQKTGFCNTYFKFYVIKVLRNYILKDELCCTRLIL